MGYAEVLNKFVVSSFKGSALTQTSAHTGINWSGRGSLQQGSKIVGRSWMDALKGVEGADRIARMLPVLSEGDSGRFPMVSRN